MSKRNLEGKIKLTSYEDLFDSGDNQNSDKIQHNDTVVENQVTEVSLDNLVEFAGHPFKVVDDEKMDETVQSIKEYGVLVPVMIRKKDDSKYEIISGHRRCHAARIAGLVTVPAIIRDCTDDEATVIMVDSNIQREDISIIEKVKAYRMKYDALKHQGVTGGSTLKSMSEASGDKMRTISRYNRLSYLSPELLQMVDERILGVVQGTELSYLSDEWQKNVYEYLPYANKSISVAQAERLKISFRDNILDNAKMYEILGIKEQKAPRKVLFNAKKLDSYFDSEMSNEDIENVIIKLLDEWKAKGGDS